MTVRSVFLFLSDFKISRQEFKGRDEIKHIIKLVNLKQHGNQSKIHQFDLEGYIEFMLQMGWFMFNNISDIPQTFMRMLFERLGETDEANEPQFKKLFDASLPIQTIKNDAI